MSVSAVILYVGCVRYSFSATGFVPAFQDTGSDEYWISTPYVGDAENIEWIPDVFEKRTNQSFKTLNKQFRCVRGGEYNDFA
jgi:hypothetical protein